jgi:predicted GNAT superfamily acetyltransferase
LENLTIKLIGDDLSIAELDNIYKINQANVPEVGSIANISEFQKLLFMGSFNLIAKIDDEVIGYIVCFRENSAYKSLNYKFFSESISSFLYIDRVAIKDTYRHQGIGMKIYEQVFNKAIELGLPVVCEVNTKPINEPSLKFHAKLGFKECGVNDFSYNSVVYLKKE